MKPAFLVLASFCILIFMSCQKEPDVQLRKKTTVQNFLGKWMLVKYSEECYKPIGNLISSNETIGAPGDSLIFKENKKLYTYSDIDGNDVEIYELLNDSTIKIEFEEWKIARLSETEFHLVSEEVEIATGEKNVVKAFLKRP